MGASWRSIGIAGRRRLRLLRPVENALSGDVEMSEVDRPVRGRLRQPDISGEREGSGRRTKVIGEAGDMEREERKVVVSGERSGLVGRARLDWRKACESDGSTGKSKCRVRDPAADHHECH